MVTEEELKLFTLATIYLSIFGAVYTALFSLVAETIKFYDSSKNEIETEEATVAGPSSNKQIKEKHSEIKKWITYNHVIKWGLVTLFNIFVAILVFFPKIFGTYGLCVMRYFSGFVIFILIVTIIALLRVRSLITEIKHLGKTYREDNSKVIMSSITTSKTS